MDAIADLGYEIAKKLVTILCEHPAILGWLAVVFVVATIVNTVLRCLWTYANMPRWARALLAVTMLFALSFDHFAAKIGINRAQAIDQLSNAKPPEKA